MWWVARNKSGFLGLHFACPERYDDEQWSKEFWIRGMRLPQDMFPDLKWEDEPIEVELKEIPKAKPISQLWEEWRFTNEWKANCQYTTFERFLEDRGIKYTVE